MSVKRKLVYNGHHGIEGEAANCLWCGRPTTEYAYVINPGGTPVLKCCCEEHYRQAESFIERDARFRPLFYVLLAIFAVVSWAAIGFLGQEPAWTPLPLVALSLLILVYPRVLPRYEYYLSLGLVKTQRVARVVAAVLLLFSLVVNAARFGVLSA